MPIILTGKKQPKVVVPPALVAENEALRKQLRDAQIALEEKQKETPPDGTRLIVNGQERKIGKKSHYLLDMLTLSEDK